MIVLWYSNWWKQGCSIKITFFFIFHHKKSLLGCSSSIHVFIRALAIESFFFFVNAKWKYVYKKNNSVCVFRTRTLLYNHFLLEEKEKHAHKIYVESYRTFIIFGYCAPITTNYNKKSFLEDTKTFKIKGLVTKKK